MRSRVTSPGWLRLHDPRRPLREESAVHTDRPRVRWLDVVQLADAMVEPFAEAIRSRFPHLSDDVRTRTAVATGASLEPYRRGDTVVDTGLQVFDRPVLRVVRTGAFICEAQPESNVFVIYTPARNPSRAANDADNGQTRENV